MIDIEKFLDKYYKQDEYIILACSSGPDSMFLLYNILKTKYKNNLVVSYFNHKLRKEADKEEKWIQKLGIKLWFKVEIDWEYIKKIKKISNSKSLEEIAREKRYIFLNNILSKYKTDKLITWHHLDDKIETFFFNLLRWTKLSWLINMKEKSWNILRPLLWMEKQEIIDYLDFNCLKYNIDKTNFDNEITRNYLRNDIIPKFYKINTKFKTNISNLLEYFDELKHYIDKEIIDFLWEKKYFLISDFNNKSIFLKKEIIRYIFFVSNNCSTIGLTESNINEVLRFIDWKNSKTSKNIKSMFLAKEKGKIIYNNEKSYYYK